MIKKRLTQHQVDRIRAAQAQRREDAARRVLVEAADGTSRRGRVVAHYGQTLAVQGEEDGAVVRCFQRAGLPQLVTGDWVVWEPDEDATGVVVALEPRHSELARPDLRGKLKPIAANVDQILVLFSAFPPTPLPLLDRYCVAAAVAQIPVILVLSKGDLLSPEDPYRHVLREYSDLGFQTLEVAFGETLNMQLMPQLQDKTSVFVGQSGVGKSTLLNRLLGVDIRVQTLSESTGKGRHTTTRAEWYALPHGGAVIDSPGIREFGLWHIPEAHVLDGFPDIADFVEHCRFRDCQHRQEPRCAVLQAVEEGTLLARRLHSYHMILESLDEPGQLDYYADPLVTHKSPARGWEPET